MSRLPVLILILFLLPLAFVWIPGTSESFDTPSDRSIDWQLLYVTVLVTSVSAVLAVVIGTWLAMLLVLCSFPWRALWATLVVIPFLCPGTVWALGQSYCYGPGGLVERFAGDAWRPFLASLNHGQYASTIWVTAQIHAPLAMLIVGRGLARLGGMGFESTRLIASPWQRLRWLWSAVRPETTSAFLLITALGLGNFAVPHVLQCRLYSIEIYMRMTNYLDRVGAFWTSLPLVVLAVLAAVGFAMMERRRDYAATDLNPRAAFVDLGRWRWLAVAGMVTYFTVTTFLPIAAIVYECRSVAKFAAATQDAIPEIRNTLLVAVTATFLAVVGGIVVGMWISHRRSLFGEALTMTLLGVPALILGLAYIRFFNVDGVIAALITSGSTLVILGLAARALPFAVRVLSTGHRRLAPQWDESAKLSGMNPWQRWRWIVGPLMLNHIGVSAILAFCIAAGEVELNQMLCAPGHGTLVLRLFTYLHFGPIHVAASLALLQILIVLLPTALYFLLTSRHPEII